MKYDVFDLIKLREPDITPEQAFKYGRCLELLLTVKGIIHRLKSLKLYLKDCRNLLVGVWFDEFSIYLETLLKEVEELGVADKLTNEDIVGKFREEIQEFRLRHEQ